MTSGVREVLGVEDEVAPVEGTEPEAVEVEDFDWDESCFHLFKEMADGLLIVVCREGSREPETKAPGWNLSWFACQDGIFCEDFFWCWAVDKVPGPWIRIFLV